MLIDEVHLLNEAGRGSALEAGVISRIAMVSRFPTMAQVGRAPPISSCSAICARLRLSTLPSMCAAAAPHAFACCDRSCACRCLQLPIASVRFVAVSASVPNIADIAQWLRVPPQGLRLYGACCHAYPPNWSDRHRHRHGVLELIQQLTLSVTAGFSSCSTAPAVKGSVVVHT